MPYLLDTVIQTKAKSFPHEGRDAFCNINIELLSHCVCNLLIVKYLQAFLKNIITAFGEETGYKFNISPFLVTKIL